MCTELSPFYGYDFFRLPNSPISLTTRTTYPCAKIRNSKFEIRTEISARRLKQLKPLAPGVEYGLHLRDDLPPPMSPFEAMPGLGCLGLSFPNANPRGPRLLSFWFSPPNAFVAVVTCVMIASV